MLGKIETRTIFVPTEKGEMMTEFISRNYRNDAFEVIIKTDSKEHYKATEDFARRLIDHAKPVTDNNDGRKWISAAERLPEDDLPKNSMVKQIKVLTALKSSNGARTVRSQMRYRMTWYTSAPWAWKCSGSEITHWMPLPELPEEEE
jgi:hypothetical protein